MKHLRTIAVAVMLVQIALAAWLCAYADYEVIQSQRWHGIIVGRRAVAVFSDRPGTYSVGYFPDLNRFGYPAAISVDGKGLWIQSSAKRIKDVKVTGFKW